MMPFRNSGLWLCVLLIPSCIYNDHMAFEDLPRVEEPQFADAQNVNVHFLGTGGIWIQGEGVSLMADPFFTNPPIWRAFWPLPTTTNESLVDRELKRLPGVQRLQSILVSHSHYDHAMDVPYIVRKLSPLCVYGSETLKHSLGLVYGTTFCGVSDKVHDNAQQEAMWITAAPRVRIAAVKAEHFSHLGDHAYADGHYHEPLPDGRASRLYEWLTGETYSYVIDILDDVPAPNQVPVFRIFYMPSAAKHPTGTPPVKILRDGKRIDLAIVGAAQLNKDTGYPGALLNCIKPAAVMMVHWENFFEGYRTERMLNIGVNPDEIAARIAASDYEGDVFWPMRGAVLERELNDLPHQPGVGSTTQSSDDRCV